MSNSEVHSNSSATHGGGLDLRGTVNITSSVIRDNSTAAGKFGGGVYITGNSQNISIQTSSIYDNDAGGFGGGVFVNSASLFVLKNSTIYDNSANFGGGFYHSNGQSILTHVTVAFNHANSAGAGVQRNNGQLRLRNTIVAESTSLNGNNRKGDCNGTIGEMTDTLIQDNNCSPTYSGNPLLASAATGSPPYYALQDGSPAIGVGVQSVIDLGLVDAIDVWGYVEQGVEVCFPDTGYVLFLDASTSPRTVTAIDAYLKDGQTCVYLDRAGSVVLTESAGEYGSLPAAEPQLQALTDCIVTTNYLLNFRDGPGGALLDTFIPYNVNLTALRRTTDWFEVDYDGERGWISAAYVTSPGNCD